MFKDTPEGQTHFCVKCEVEARGDEEAKRLALPNLKHECGKEEVVKFTLEEKKVDPNDNYLPDWGFRK